MVFSEFRKLQAINFLFITCKAILAKYVSHKTPSKAPLLPYEIGPQSFLILPICEFLANRQRKMHAEDFDMHLSYMKGYLIARCFFTYFFGPDWSKPLFAAACAAFSAPKSLIISRLLLFLSIPRTSFTRAKSFSARALQPLGA